MKNEEVHYLTCTNDNCERAVCVGRRDYEERLDLAESALKEAVVTINAVQNEIGQFTFGSGTVSSKFREAWNLNSAFLSKHYTLQNDYLRSKGLLT